MKRNARLLLDVRLMLLTSAAVACALLSASSFAQDEIDAEKYAKVKAGMVLNFIRYTTWPQHRFSDDQSPIEIAILGEDDMTAELESIVADERVHGRRIVVHQIDTPSPNPRTGIIEPEAIERYRERMRSAHLLYVAFSERPRFRDALDIVTGAHVLTVSDIDNFAREGGMLGLVVRRNRVAFDANITEIRRTELEVSSKLLRLAEIVESRESSP